MSDKKPTFSRQVKDELCRLACASECCQKAELAAAFFAAGHFLETAVSLSTAHSGSALRLAGLIRRRYQVEPEWQTGRELINLTIRGPETIQAIRADLDDLFGRQGKPSAVSSRNALADCCRQAILRALFLACGSISEPSAAYHLELTLRQPEAAAMAVELLERLSIRAGQVSRHGHPVVYLKEGQHIADFLLLTGAHHALLDFESLRVEKEMRNSVNRMVNCDSANTQRMANTSARQLELIRELTERGGLPLLPPDLQDTAGIRLENPDLSIKELGELLNPPLGKSGMNHRLKRLEQAAADFLGKKGSVTDGT
jgi:cell division protein WhiA